MIDLASIAAQLQKPRCKASDIYEHLKDLLSRKTNHNLSAEEVSEAKKLKLLAKGIKDGIVSRQQVH